MAEEERSQRGAVGDLEEGSVRIVWNGSREGRVPRIQPNHSAGQGGTSLTKHRLLCRLRRGAPGGRGAPKRLARREAGDNDARRGYATAAETEAGHRGNDERTGDGVYQWHASPC